MSTDQAREWFSQIPEEPPARRSSRLLLALLAVVVVMCVVMAVLIVRNLRDEPSPVDPAIAARAAAVEAAKETYRRFIETDARVLGGGGVDLAAYDATTTGQARRYATNEARNLRTQKLHTIGQASITSLEEQTVLLGSTDDPTSRVTLLACLDVLGFTAVDAKGTTKTPADRPRWYTSRVDVAEDPANSTWLLTNYKAERTSKC